MSWADTYIEKLKKGETVEFRPRGNSMVPHVNSKELVRVSPVKPTTLKKGDIVLCRVSGKDYLHLISAIKKNSFQISNAKGRVNGTTKTIYGKLVSLPERKILD